MKHSHYKKSVAGLEFIDVYRVVELFDVPAGALDHAAKKILCAGNRGHKDLARDVQDVIDSLQRWQEMRAEDARIQVKVEPASMIDDDSRRQQGIEQGGEMGPEVYAAIDAAKLKILGGEMPVYECRDCRQIILTNGCSCKL